MPADRSLFTRTAIVVLVIAVALGGLALAARYAFDRITATSPPPPGCQLGPAAYSTDLDPGQAGIASLIAGVAARRHLPEQALTIALATAMQESQLENLPYGDRDSLGVFQQRPSQGWGTRAQIENPVYATTRFFEALVQVPRYTKIPVDVAAQDVQHSADGSAYGSQAYVAGLLAGYLTGKPAANIWQVTCWYTPATGQRADVSAARKGLVQTFGPAGRDDVMVRDTTASYDKILVEAQPRDRWTVAAWLVTHAQEYQISNVRYAGYEWEAADGSMGWQRDPGPSSDTIVAG
ncbi:MAG TPA: hypothetical protein VGG16_28070 [Streptosporangiaceae bacterium]